MVGAAGDDVATATFAGAAAGGAGAIGVYR